MFILPNRYTGAAAALAALTVFAAAAPGARAQFVFVNSDATVAKGNPLSGNYGTNVVIIGLQQNNVSVPGVHADIIDPAVFTYSNLVGRGVEAYSNSIVSVTGGSIGNGLSALEQSDVTVSGGTIRNVATGGFNAPTTPRLTINAGATISHNLSGNAAANIPVGTLTVNGGTLTNITNNGEGIRLFGTGAALVRGGTIQAINTAGSGVFAMSGGVVNGLPGSNAQAINLQSTVAASFTGGTVNGGIQSNSQPGAGFGSANISGTAIINDGVFSLAANTSAINVFGGTFGGNASPATFFALGGGSINFFGTGLALSLPTPGSYTMPQGIGSTTYLGNFYTITGTLRDGQSINRVVFDALTSGGSPTGYSGGITVNTVSAAAPEPGTLALLFTGAALPFAGFTKHRHRFCSVSRKENHA